MAEAQQDELHSIINTKDHGYALAGFTGSSGEGYFDFWFVKTDAVGNVEWSKTYVIVVGIIFSVHCCI